MLIFCKSRQSLCSQALLSQRTRSISLTTRRRVPFIDRVPSILPFTEQEFCTLLKLLVEARNHRPADTKAFRTPQLPVLRPHPKCWVNLHPAVGKKTFSLADKRAHIPMIRAREQMDCLFYKQLYKSAVDAFWAGQLAFKPLAHNLN